MIYTISEYTATAIDSIVLICFLAYTLSFKKPKQKLNIVTSIAFMLLFFSCVTIFNNITIAEGIYAAFYFLIFFYVLQDFLKRKMVAATSAGYNRTGSIIFSKRCDYNYICIHLEK